MVTSSPQLFWRVANNNGFDWSYCRTGTALKRLPAPLGVDALNGRAVSVTLWPVAMKNDRHIPLKTWSTAMMFSRRRICNRLTEITPQELTTKKAHLFARIDRSFVQSPSTDCHDRFDGRSLCSL